MTVQSHLRYRETRLAGEYALRAGRQSMSRFRKYTETFTRDSGLAAEIFRIGNAPSGTGQRSGSGGVAARDATCLEDERRRGVLGKASIEIGPMEFGRPRPASGWLRPAVVRRIRVVNLIMP